MKCETVNLDRCAERFGGNVIFTGTVSPATLAPYINHPFTVPAGTRRVTVTLEYSKPGLCQLYLSVFALDQYRGSRMMPAAIGAVKLELDLSESTASLGGIAGAIPAGEWRAQLDLERTAFTVDYRLSVELSDLEPVSPEATNPEAVAATATLEPAVQTAGWYRGELHSHSTHSDGREDVAAVVASALHHGLNFISLTDHFTTAGWTELEQLAPTNLCVMRGLEITGHRGHANLHGLQSWVNPFVDQPQTWTINDAARAAHAQGALFCVNHPFALDLGWRYHEFDWGLCDLLEVYHHLEGEGNTRQLALWDELLRAGQRITGVAGTDSHDPFRGRHRLGQVVTVVHADALEPSAILGGLKRGAAYVSLGAELGFTAQSGPRQAGMGETLHADKTVQLEIELTRLEHPARLVVLKNGWYFTHVDLPASAAQTVTLEDSEVIGGYYRLEVYARSAQPQIGSGREWAQTLCLSNPIYIEMIL